MQCLSFSDWLISLPINKSFLPVFHFRPVTAVTLIHVCMVLFNLLDLNSIYLSLQ